MENVVGWWSSIPADVVVVKDSRRFNVGLTIAVRS